MHLISRLFLFLARSPEQLAGTAPKPIWPTPATCTT